MQKEIWRTSGLNNPIIACVMLDLPPIEQWATLDKSLAWFSGHHFNDNQAFELSFDPTKFVYSPLFETITKQGVVGHYRRGVKKYQGMIRRIAELPPITYVWNTRNLTWEMQDGNHRTEASRLEGIPLIRTIFAYPKKQI